MKRLILLALLVSSPFGRLWAANEALFTSVTGKVEIRGHKGHMLRLAEKNGTVTEGERIVAASDAQATFQTFDGSEITINPNTDFWLDKLQRPTTDTKTIHFKLLFGQLMAKVTKLLNAKSSFEIEAGGVICGVRGTQYQVKYDPSTNTVYLGVLEGTVFATSNGQTTDYGAGSSAVFHDGIPVGGGNNHLPGGGTGGATGNGGPGNGLPGNGIPGNGQPGNGQSGNGAQGNGLPGNGVPSNGVPGNGLPGNGGQGSNDSVQTSLFDIDNQFHGKGFILDPGSNPNQNIITNPSLTSTYQRVNVTANVPPVENGP